MLGWSKKRLEELLGSMVLVDDGCLSATATGVVSITGDANLYQRKKKLIPHYELEIKVPAAIPLRLSSGLALL